MPMRHPSLPTPPHRVGACVLPDLAARPRTGVRADHVRVRAGRVRVRAGRGGSLRRVACLACLLLPLAGLGMPWTARAAEPADPSPLGIRQEGVQERVRQLEEALLRLARTVRETEPHLAARLEAVIGQTRTLRIEERTALLARLLHSAEFSRALPEQDALLRDLQGLLQILMEGNDLERIRERIEELRQFRDAVDALARAEWEQMRASQDQAAREEAQERMQAQLASLDDLIGKQGALLDETRKGAEDGAPLPPDAAARQDALAGESQHLAESMQQTAAGSDVPDRQRTPEPGEAALQAAAGHQGDAAGALAEDRVKTGIEEQQAALDRLQEARAELQAAKDALAQADDGETRATRQDAQETTAGETDALTREMEARAGQSGDPSAPGGESMQQASAAMQQAAESIGEGADAAAAQAQEAAHKELQEASRDIQEAIADLEKDRRAALLAHLEGLFTSMLETQRELRTRTEGLDGKRNAGTWGRPEDIACAEVARGQAGLAEPGREALSLLEEDGGTTVFPMIVAEMIEDILAAAGHLDAGRVDAYARSIQVSVEQTLEALIDAMEKAQEEGPPPDPEEDGSDGDNGSEGEPQPQPLFDILQELRLMRAAQQRINLRTGQADRLAPAERESEPVRRDLHRLAERQDVLHQALRALLEKAAPPVPIPPQLDATPPPGSPEPDSASPPLPGAMEQPETEEMPEGGADIPDPDGADSLDAVLESL